MPLKSPSGACYEIQLPLGLPFSHTILFHGVTIPSQPHFEDRNLAKSNSHIHPQELYRIEV